MQQFTGRTEAECLREAKAEGWYVGVKNKELCPKHYLEKQKKETWDSRMAYWNYKTGKAFFVNEGGGWFRKSK